MALEVVTANARRVAQWSAIALGASIPISTALDNVLIAILLTAWALSGQLRSTAQLVARNHLVLISAALFLLLAVGASYGEVSKREALANLSKYADLLYIPVLMVVFRTSETRMRALHALAFSLASIIVLSCFIRLGWVPKLPFITGTVESPTVFKLKLTHNLLVAFGAFLFVWLGHTIQNRRMRAVWYGLALLAAFNVVWMVQGATGYLVLFALTVLLAAQFFGNRETAALLIALAAVLAVGISVPSRFQERVITIKSELQDWNPADSAKTSTGLRLEFYQNTLAIMADRPLTGVGTGGFPAAYARQVQGTGKVETHNPHNEFLLIGAQVGIFGMVLLATLLVIQWRLAGDLLSPRDRGLARGLVLTMLIGCLFNSFLLDHAEGLFYAWLTGALYGGLEYRPRDTSPAPT